MFINAKVSELKPYTQPSFLMVALAACAAIVGCSAYFALVIEPSVTILSVLSICCAVLCYLFKNSLKKSLLLWFALCSLLFTLVTAIHIQQNNTYMLPEQYNNTRHWVVGQLSEMKAYEKRAKVILSHAYIYGVDEDVPDNLNIKLSVASSRLQDFTLGDWMAVEMKLFSPKNPEYDDGYDFRLKAWLDNVSAVGYAFGEVHRTSWPEGWRQSNYYIDKLRKNITERIVGTEDESESATRGIMAALITGNRTFIPQDIYDAYRDSGMAHLLAISGLHIGLVTGFVFLLFRRIIGCTPWIIHRVSSKKVAAVFAMLGAGSYTLLAGMTLPTLRAFLMVSLLLFAMLASRLGLSLRSFCITVIVVLSIWPESILSASFQMSFAAVFALLVWAERSRIQESLNTHFYGVSYDVMRYMQAVFITSFVAGLATLPIAAWHFGSVSLSGILTNVAAIPLTAFVIMPSAFLGLLLMPLGLDGFAFFIMEYGVYLLNSVALWGQGLLTSGLPIIHHAKWTLIVGMPVVLTSFLILKRRYAVLSIPLIFMLYFVDLFVQKDAVYVTKNAETAVYLGGDPLLLFGEIDKGLTYFVRNYYGQDKQVKSLEKDCDSEGCLLKLNDEQVLVVSEDHTGLSGDICYGDTLVLAPSILHMEDCPRLFRLNADDLGAYLYSETEIQYKKQAVNRIWHQ